MREYVSHKIRNMESCSESVFCVHEDLYKKWEMDTVLQDGKKI